MVFLKSLEMKIKNFGTSKIINALDLLEPVLATRIEMVREQFVRMDSKEMSKYLIDQFQEMLRVHFGIPPK